MGSYWVIVKGNEILEKGVRGRIRIVFDWEISGEIEGDVSLGFVELRWEGYIFDIGGIVGRIIFVYVFISSGVIFGWSKL